MARAKLVGKPVVELTLSQWEAETLRYLCGLIGGDPDKRRGAMDNIASALDEVGVKQASLQSRGDIYFIP
jgi:hypothetical protein